jgi:hypothetical protein
VNGTSSIISSASESQPILIFWRYSQRHVVVGRGLRYQDVGFPNSAVFDEPLAHQAELGGHEDVGADVDFVERMVDYREGSGHG